MRTAFAFLAGTMILAGADVVLSPSGSANYSGMLGSIRAILAHFLDPGVPLIPDLRTKQATPPSSSPSTTTTTTVANTQLAPSTQGALV